MAKKSKEAYDIRLRAADSPIDKSDMDRRRSLTIPTVTVNGVSVTGASNFSSSTPAAPAGNSQVAFQSDAAGNISGSVAPRFSFKNLFFLMGA